VARLFTRAQTGIERHHYRIRKDLLGRAKDLAKWRSTPQYDPFFDRRHEELC
jgi:hypothetical protein